jgi:hypothetical protein
MFYGVIDQKSNDVYPQQEILLKKDVPIGNAKIIITAHIRIFWAEENCRWLGGQFLRLEVRK